MDFPFLCFQIHGDVSKQLQAPTILATPPHCSAWPATTCCIPSNYGPNESFLARAVSWGQSNEEHYKYILPEQTLSIGFSQDTRQPSQLAVLQASI